MAAAKTRRELAQLAVRSSSTPGGSSSGGDSVVGKRIRGKSSYTPSTTPSTKTPDPKAMKVLEGTPGQARKELFAGRA